MVQKHHRLALRHQRAHVALQLGRGRLPGKRRAPVFIQDRLAVFGNRGLAPITLRAVEVVKDEDVVVLGVIRIEKYFSGRLFDVCPADGAATGRLIDN